MDRTASPRRRISELQRVIMPGWMHTEGGDSVGALNALIEEELDGNYEPNEVR